MTDKSLGLARRTLLGVMLAVLVMAAPVAALAEGDLLGDETILPQDEVVADSTEMPDESVIAGEAVDGDGAEAEGEVSETPSSDEGDATEEGTLVETVDDAEEADATVEVADDEEAVTSEESGEKAEALEIAATPLPTCPSGATVVADGTYYIQAMLAKTLLIEAQGKAPSNGAAVQTATYTGAKNQRWVVKRYQDTNWYQLHLKYDDSLLLGVGDASSGAAITVIKASGDAQVETLWAFVPNSNGTLRLVSAANTSLALSVKGSSTSSGTALVLGSAKGTANQRVTLVPVAPSVKEGTKGLEGAYVLMEKKSGLVATISGGKTSNGANLALSANKGSESQKVYLEPVDGGGYYVAWVIGTRKVLSVAGSNPLSGANVNQSNYKKTNAQKWAVVKDVDGNAKLVNKGTGLSLSAAGTSEGSNLAGQTKGSSFALKRVALVDAGIVEIKPMTESSVSVSVSKASTKSGAAIVLWKDNDTLNQRFQLVSAGKTDLWRLRTASSGGYITVKDGKLSQQGKGATKASSGNVWRVTFRGGWYGLMLDDGSELSVNLSGGKTVKGTKLGVAKANGSDAQHLTFNEASLIKPGVYFFKNAKGKYLHVKSNSSTPGANVETYKKDKNRLLGEYFTIEKIGSYVRIKNTYSELCVAARGKSVGSNVAMRNASTNNSQKWEPQIADGGYVVLKGVGGYKKLALNVSKGSAKNGANVLMGKRTGGAAQKWKPIATTYNPYTGYMLKALRTAYSSGSATNYLMVVDRANTRVMIMKRNGTEWRLHRRYLCSCGKSSTPTITGSYTVGSRGYQFTDGDHTCYYWTEISGDYLFHSVLYHAGTLKPLDGRLGYHISMGCVRLSIDHAKWIYDNIPSGTKIVIY